MTPGTSSIIHANPTKQDGSESRCDVDFSLLKAHVCGVKSNGGKGKDRGGGAGEIEGGHPGCYCIEDTVCPQARFCRYIEREEGGGVKRSPYAVLADGDTDRKLRQRHSRWRVPCSNVT